MIRKIARSYIFFVIITLSHTICSSGQGNNLKFENPILIRNQNFVYSICRDANDYLWFGKKETGLTRFDGYQLVNYVHEKDKPSSLSSNIINCIMVDSRKNLWIGTEVGLNLYMPEIDSFQHFTQKKDAKSISNDCVNSLFEDREGRLWIGTNSGLNKFVYQTKTFTTYSISKRARADNIITSIVQDSKGQLWLGTYGNCLWNFEPITGKFTPYLSSGLAECNNCMKKILIDKNDRFWIIVNGGGFFSFEPKTGKFKHYNLNKNGKGINSDILMDIIADTENSLLIGTNGGGINRFDKKSETFDYITADETNPYGLTHSGVYCFHKDKEGIIWIGTARGGINCYNPKKQKFQLFRYNKNASNVLINNIVGCFFEDSEGLIWIGTDGGGISVFNKKNNTFENFVNDPKNPNSLSGNFVRSIKEDKDHKIWIATWAAGLNRYDKKKRKFQRFTQIKNDTTSLSNDIVWNIHIDHKNHIWLAYLFGLDLFDPQKGKVIKHFTKYPIHNNLRVLLIQQKDENNIWLNTSDGLFRYDFTSDRFHVFDKFPDKSTKSFLKDNNGNLWVGSSKDGLFYCNPDGSLKEVFTTKNGLPNNQIFGIVQDNTDDIWISTDNGLCRYRPSNKTFRTYSESDGLQGNQFMEQSFLKARDGQIFFGGTNGFNAFYPEQIIDNKSIPQVFITSFEIFNKPVIPGKNNSPLNKQIALTKEISLSYKQSVFSFSFIAINHTIPEKNQYAYIMENFEKEWNYTDASRRFATYTNLNPGEYFFRVKASNNDGIWNETGTTIKIIITPPLWEAWWFRTLVISFILVCLISFYRIRVNGLKHQKRILEIKVEERTHELKDANIILKEKQDEIQQQSEELMKMNEEVLTMNEELHQRNEEISSIVKKLEIQNSEIKGKNEHIKSSIQYAMTIQQAILPTTEMLNKFFAHFLIYKPKDIVSGDFYWLADIPVESFESFGQVVIDRKCMLAVADCTGHGVPGAFMSMICNSLLNEVVFEMKIYEPNLILEKLNIEIRKALRQDLTNNYDGMDISIVRFDFLTNKTIHACYSGAKLDIFYYNFNEKILTPIPATRLSIGGRRVGYNKEDSYKKNDFIIYPNDLLYLTSDGYTDQANFERNRFGMKRFINIIKENVSKSLAEQATILENELAKWQGVEPQRDDITVIGLKNSLVTNF